jgi:hypothetical protein
VNYAMTLREYALQSWEPLEQLHDGNLTICGRIRGPKSCLIQGDPGIDGLKLDPWQCWSNNPDGPEFSFHEQDDKLLMKACEVIGFNAHDIAELISVLRS